MANVVVQPAGPEPVLIHYFSSSDSAPSTGGAGTIR
jgi:hypothetical protein